MEMFRHGQRILHILFLMVNMMAESYCYLYSYTYIDAYVMDKTFIEHILYSKRF